MMLPQLRPLHGQFGIAPHTKVTNHAPALHSIAFRTGTGSYLGKFCCPGHCTTIRYKGRARFSSQPSPIQRGRSEF